MIASVQSKLDAEYAVLGSVLIDDRCAGEMLSRLRGEDFCDQLRPVYFAIRHLFQGGQAVDPVAVVQILGGGDYRKLIFHLMEITPTSANCKVYIDLLLQQAQLLRVRDLAAAFVDNPDSDSIPDLMAAVGAASGGSRHTNRYTAEARWLRFLDRQTGEPRKYVDWSFPALNRAVQTEPGDFILIGAEPSAGKTALAIQLADGQSRTMRVGFYSLETSEEKLTDRQMAMRNALPLRDIKNQSIPERTWESMVSNSPTFCARSFDVIEAAGWSALDVETDAVSKGYDVVYVDYLQLLRWERGETEYQAVTRTTKQLHTFAQRRKVTVVALSQFSRNKDHQEPTMQSLRSSGQIEADADAILLLYCSAKDKMDPKTRRLKVAKNKEGPKGTIPLTFDGATQRFDLNWSALKNQPPEEPALHEITDAEPFPTPENQPEQEPEPEQISL